MYEVIWKTNRKNKIIIMILFNKHDNNIDSFE